MIQHESCTPNERPLSSDTAGEHLRRYCVCGHPLNSHSVMIEGRPCRDIEQIGNGDWIDCKCRAYQVGPVSRYDSTGRANRGDEHSITWHSLTQGTTVFWVICSCGFRSPTSNTRLQMRADALSHLRRFA